MEKSIDRFDERLVRDVDHFLATGGDGWSDEKITAMCSALQDENSVESQCARLLCDRGEQDLSRFFGALDVFRYSRIESENVAAAIGVEHAKLLFLEQRLQDLVDGDNPDLADQLLEVVRHTIPEILKFDLSKRIEIVSGIVEHFGRPAKLEAGESPGEVARRELTPGERGDLSDLSVPPSAVTTEDKSVGQSNDPKKQRGFLLLPIALAFLLGAVVVYSLSGTFTGPRQSVANAGPLPVGGAPKPPPQARGDDPQSPKMFGVTLFNGGRKDLHVSLISVRGEGRRPAPFSSDGNGQLLLLKAAPSKFASDDGPAADPADPNGKGILTIHLVPARFVPCIGAIAVVSRDSLHDRLLNLFESGKYDGMSPEELAAALQRQFDPLNDRRKAAILLLDIASVWK